MFDSTLYTNKFLYIFLSSNELVRKFSTITLSIYLLFLYCIVHMESGWQIQYNEQVDPDDPEFESQQRQEMCLFSRTHRPALWPNHRGTATEAQG